MSPITPEQLASTMIRHLEAETGEPATDEDRAQALDQATTLLADPDLAAALDPEEE